MRKNAIFIQIDNDFHTKSYIIEEEVFFMGGIFNLFKKKETKKESVASSFIEIRDSLNQTVTTGRVIREIDENKLVLSNDFHATAVTPPIYITKTRPSKEPIFLTGNISHCNEEQITLSDLNIIQEGDRRNAFRIKSHVFGKLEYDYEIFPVMLADISLTGAMIFSSNKLTAGTTSKIQFKLNETPINLDCKIVRQKGDDFYGIKFLNVTPNQMEDLYNYILSLQTKELRTKRRRG